MGKATKSFEYFLPMVDKVIIFYLSVMQSI